MSTELHTYISDERKRGVTDEDIRAELTKKGWAREKIDDAFGTAPSPAPSPSDMDGRKYSNLGLLFAFLSVIIFPVIFGPLGVYFGVKGYLREDRTRGMVAIVLSVILATANAVLGAYLATRG